MSILSFSQCKSPSQPPGRMLLRQSTQVEGSTDLGKSWTQENLCFERNCLSIHSIDTVEYDVKGKRSHVLFVGPFVDNEYDELWTVDV